MSDAIQPCPTCGRCPTCGNYKPPVVVTWPQLNAQIAPWPWQTTTSDKSVMATNGARAHSPLATCSGRDCAEPQCTGEPRSS